MLSKQKGLSLLLGTSITLMSPQVNGGLSYGQVSRSLYENPHGELAREIVQRWPRYSSSEKRNFQVFYTNVTFKDHSVFRDLKQDLGISQHGVDKKFNYLLSLKGMEHSYYGEFKKGIERLANHDCNGKSCLSYLYNLSLKKASKVPSKYYFQEKVHVVSTKEKKARFLFHYNLAQAWRESGFFNIVSHDGAIGLLQVTPCTAKSLDKKRKDISLDLNSKNYSFKKSSCSNAPSDSSLGGKSSRLRESDDDLFSYDKNILVSLELNLDGLRNTRFFKKIRDKQNLFYGIWNFEYGLVDHNAGNYNLKQYYLPCIKEKKNLKKCNSNAAKRVKKETPNFVRSVRYNFKKLQDDYYGKGKW